MIVVLTELSFTAESAEAMRALVPSSDVLAAFRRATDRHRDGCHDQVAAAIATHPGRFNAFATLPMSDVGASLRELDRTLKEYGFKGAPINGRTDGRAPPAFPGAPTC
jgi:predicted TIM-barrel fold metal-dependent hydrolase